MELYHFSICLFVQVISLKFLSEKLLEVLGCRLMPMNPSHQWINEALHVKYPDPFKSTQSYLEEFGVEI